MLAQTPSEDSRDSDEMTEMILQLLDDDFRRRNEGFVETMSSLLLDDRQRALEEPPELLSTLGALGHRGPLNGLALHVASATKAAFDVIRQALQPRLSVCSIEKGAGGDEHLLLSVYSPRLTADIGVNDTVAAGVLVALHGEPGGVQCRLEVLPRLYRKICQNGAIVSSGVAPGYELNLQRLLRSKSLKPLTHALVRAIRACFDPKGFEAAVNSFQRSASEPIDAGSAHLLVGGLSPEVRQAVLQRFSAEGDFTRWGLLNAVTAEARTASSGLMLTLERLGGELARQSVAPAARQAGTSGLPHAKKRLAAA
jgi:hypothetical protein